jgi:hypothetical protein
MADILEMLEKDAELEAAGYDREGSMEGADKVVYRAGDTEGLF